MYVKLLKKCSGSKVVWDDKCWHLRTGETSLPHSILALMEPCLGTAVTSLLQPTTGYHLHGMGISGGAGTWNINFLFTVHPHKGRKKKQNFNLLSFMIITIHHHCLHYTSNILQNYKNKLTTNLICMEIHVSYLKYVSLPLKMFIQPAG
jgi:hypothetical protein